MNATTEFQERDSFELAVIAFQDGRISRDQLAQRSYSTIRRFAKVASHATDIEDEADDVAQALWIMFVNRIAPEYDRSKPIYPYLTTFARNLARNARWQRKATPNLPTGFDGEHDEEGIADRKGVMWKEGESSIEDGVSRHMALEQVSLLLGQGKSNPAPHHGVMPGVEIVHASPSPLFPQARPVKSPAKLAPDQEELVKIRLKLGMTQPEFADILGINVPRLSSWEYGRTKGVPEFYMDQARQLLSMGNRPHEDGMRLFGDKTMSEILLKWAKELEVDVDDTYTLSQLIDVSEPTIRRWRSNEVKPSISKINHYQAIVNRIRRRAQGNSHG